MKVLIVGLGSIANKHIKVLRTLYSPVEIFAFRSRNSKNNEDGVISIYDISEITADFDFAIISNPSSLHYSTIESLITFGFPLFVEKPVLGSTKNADHLIKLIKDHSVKTYVACNLRFHPAIEFMKTVFETRKPLEYTAYCGSYLPEWRPEQDYRKSYSASKDLGGGVHLDLIHEIDYTIYLLGQPKNVLQYLGKKSDLEINTPDVAHYVFEYESSSAFITLNYYRTDTKRTIECVWKDDTWSVDLINNTIVNSKNEIVFKEDFQMLDTYKKQMKYFLQCIQENTEPMNNIEEAIRIMKTYLNE
jgi:predicted dehydrogenase